MKPPVSKHALSSRGAPSWRVALARHVSDPAHAGVYRLEAPRLAALCDIPHGAVGDALGVDWHCLTAAPRWNREALLDGLAAGLAFPDYFGRNWDAAWDCLTELAWVPGRPRVVAVPAAPLEEGAMATFVELMADAAEHWVARGQILVTLIGWNGEASAGLPALPDLPPQAMDGLA
uniref:barstar family protein n=1 Tax=uncultured Halomonas sp. TaxID=173971 RepID=UPI002608E39F|nr:barstar family protein [uncultured Halomonas sp.]